MWRVHYTGGAATGAMQASREGRYASRWPHANGDDAISATPPDRKIGRPDLGSSACADRREEQLEVEASTPLGTGLELQLGSHGLEQST